MSPGAISVDDPTAPDVRDLVARHQVFAASLSPPENVFALDATGLRNPDVTLFSCRRDGELLAIGALRHLDERHCELKSMHTAEAVRRSGIGRAMLRHLIDVARQRGYQRISLETGSMAGFSPARALYTSAGFTECGPFGDYQPSPYSTFLSLELRPPRPGQRQEAPRPRSPMKLPVGKGAGRCGVDCHHGS